MKYAILMKISKTESGIICLVKTTGWFLKHSRKKKELKKKSKECYPILEEED